MRFLIAGGSGFIGSHYIKHLQSQSQNHSIYVMGRSPQKLQQQFGDQVKTISWEDFLNQPQLLQELDVIINLAGANIAEQRWNSQRKEILFNSRIRPTTQIMEHLIQHRSQHIQLLNASAIGYYGYQPQNKMGINFPVDEMNTRQQEMNFAFLAAIAYGWEQATELAQQCGIRVVNLRFGIVLHPDGGMLKQLLTSFRFGLGAMIGDGQQILSWIALDDVINAIDWIITQPELYGPVNMVSPQPVTQQQFADTLAKILHRPRFLKLPASLVKLMFGEEMAKELLLTGQAVLPKILQEGGFKFKYPDLESALSDYL